MSGQSSDDFSSDDTFVSPLSSTSGCNNLAEVASMNHINRLLFHHYSPQFDNVMGCSTPTTNDLYRGEKFTRTRSGITLKSWRKSVPPPSPRLVCVELNPGPDRSDQFMKSLATLGVVLGKAAAKGKKKKERKPKRPKKRSRSLALAPTSTTNSVYQAASLFDMSSRKAVIPNGHSTIHRFSNSNTTYVHSFSALSCSLQTNASGVPTIAGVASQYSLPLRPHETYGVGSALSHPFGHGIYNLAQTFAEFRVLKLQIKFHASLNPNGVGVFGNLCMGYTPDGATDPTTIWTIDQLSNVNGSIFGSSWNDLVVDCPNLDSGWKYCMNAASENTATDRQDTCGTLLVCNGYSGNLASTPIGHFTIHGVIEFRGLANLVTPDTLRKENLRKHVIDVVGPDTPVIVEHEYGLSSSSSSIPQSRI